MTHSSDDDIRTIMRELKDGNYMVPPAPKPVNQLLLNGRMVFPPIEVKGQLKSDGISIETCLEIRNGGSSTPNKIGSHFTHS